MNSYGRAEVQIHAFFFSALDCGKWCDASALYPGERTLDTIKQEAVKTPYMKFVMRSVCICIRICVGNWIMAIIFDLRLLSASNMDIKTGSLI
jgi:hypothetical protein